jgi:predicted alpha/beta superfamily hydrolase
MSKMQTVRRLSVRKMWIVSLAVLAALQASSAQIAWGQDILAGTYVDNVTRSQIHSDATGCDYDLWISLPSDYQASARQYPLLLLLDGSHYFALADTAARLVHDDQAGGDVIIVAIAAAGPPLRHEVQRLRDYIPEGVPPKMVAMMTTYLKSMFARRGMSAAQWEEISKRPLFGGADSFLSFVETQLIPNLKARYRVDPAAMGIAGHSAAGAFVGYALLKGAPFSRYLIGSYTIDWYGDRLSELEAGFSARNDPPPIQVYESHGEFEPVQLKVGEEAFQRSSAMLDRLAVLRPAKMTVTHRIVAGQGHSGSAAATFAGGIRALFPPDN